MYQKNNKLCKDTLTSRLQKRLIWGRKKNTNTNKTTIRKKDAKILQLY